MRSALVRLGVVLTLALTGGAVDAAAQDALPITPTGDATFPARSFRFTVPASGTLRTGDVKVTENGEPVDKLVVSSGRDAAASAFGIVLVIDTSASMRGRPIRGAMAAARVLAAQRPPGQRLGVVLFNKTATVLLEPTTDGAAIDRALKPLPVLAPRTQIFDGVNSALTLLQRSKIAAGTVVVLSDGADTGSVVPATTVARLAGRRNVQIFTVGLRSGVTNERELRALAMAGNGRYTPAASVVELRRIFRRLGAELAGSTLLTYRSAAEPGREVIVAVRFAGLRGAATSSYVVPGGATYVQVEDNFWTSNTALLVVGGLCALLLAIGLAVLLLRRVDVPNVRDRIRGFVSEQGTVDGDVVALGNATWTRADTTGGFGGERWLRFVDDVEIARIQTPAGRIANLTAAATLLVTVLLIASTGLVLVGLFGLAIPFVVRTVVRIRRDRERKKFEEQLPDLLQGTASAVRAGQSLVSALAMISDDAPEPCRREFQRVVADEGLGVPLEVALKTVQERMMSRAVVQLGLIAEIQREAGGNMAEVLDRITDSLRQAAELRRMISALTAQGRLSRWVVSAIPLALLFFVSIISPDYVRPLFTEAGGIVLLVTMGVMMTAGSMAIGKIVDFEV